MNARGGRRRPAGGRWRARLTALSCAAVAGCAAWLAVAPAAPAAVSGQISGTVTSAKAPGEGLAHVEVYAYEAGGAELPVSATVTGPGGAYVLEDLAPGAYKIQFVPEEGRSLNYVPQFYKASPTFAGATPVEVPEGGSQEGIDAELQEGGTLEGTVTDAEDHAPLAQVEVAVYEADGEGLQVSAATTDASGHYVVDGLATGSYKVEFSPGYESDLDYVTQFYDGESSLATATPVAVVQEAVTPGIDADLEPGGKIEGTVTDAYTHAPVAGAIVGALSASGAVEGETSTEADGHYTLTGLAAGAHVVEFAAAHYVVQYFDDKPSLVSADPVSVRTRSATTGIDAALVPRVPVNTAAPVASGTPAAGQTVSCSSGSWTGSPAPSYAYAWLHDGVPIPAATASAYVVQAADVGNGLTCKVTATNRSGSTAAVSNTLIVPVPSPPPPSAPSVRLSASVLGASAGLVRVPLACAGASCAGTIELTERVTVTTHHRHGRATSSHRTLLLGVAVYSLAAGASATIVVHLPPVARRALANARHHRLPVTLSLAVAGGTTVRMSVVLTEAGRVLRAGAA